MTEFNNKIVYAVIGKNKIFHIVFSVYIFD